MKIELTTPGYGRFSQQSDAFIARQPPIDASFPNELAQSETDPTMDVHDAGVPGCRFLRTLEFRSLIEQQRPMLHQRTHSLDVLSSMTRPSDRNPRQCFVFSSPWQGLCTFSAGMDGKSLRCKHSLPNANPLQDPDAASVAEIRYNLPWSVLSTKDRNQREATSEEADKLPLSKLVGASNNAVFRRSMQHIRHKSWARPPNDQYSSSNISAQSAVGKSSSLEEERQNNEEECRLSLKLGREKAGGGFKGKSAKLGKLIIEDEGLKMCDLVVAACMGLWWQQYTTEGPE